MEMKVDKLGAKKEKMEGKLAEAKEKITKEVSKMSPGYMYLYNTFQAIIGGFEMDKYEEEAWYGKGCSTAAQVQEIIESVNRKFDKLITDVKDYPEIEESIRVSRILEKAIEVLKEERATQDEDDLLEGIDHKIKWLVGVIKRLGKNVRKDYLESVQKDVQKDILMRFEKYIYNKAEEEDEDEEDEEEDEDDDVDERWANRNLPYNEAEDEDEEEAEEEEESVEKSVKDGGCTT